MTKALLLIQSIYYLPMTKPSKKIAMATLLLLAAGCNYQEFQHSLAEVPANSTPKIAVEMSDLREMEKLVHEQVNEYRRSQNLPPLTLNSAISEQARIHSQNMADSKVLSHRGFEERVDAIGQTISYRSAAENVATNLGYSDPGNQAVEGWIQSPGHQKNMVGNYNLTGIGIAITPGGQYYFTQIFIRSR